MRGNDFAAILMALRHEMNQRPDIFGPLGEAEMRCAVVIGDRDDATTYLVDFEGIECTSVSEASGTEPGTADFRLEGSVDSWNSMFDDIVEHGRATGTWTLNSLALLGGRIDLAGDDPMGLDRFSRFNQTLQEFFDGAVRVAVATS